MKSNVAVGFLKVANNDNELYIKQRAFLGTATLVKRRAMRH